MKKILLTLGTAVIAVAPLAVAISCGSKEKSQTLEAVKNRPFNEKEMNDAVAAKVASLANKEWTKTFNFKNSMMNKEHFGKDVLALKMPTKDIFLKEMADMLQSIPPDMIGMMIPQLQQIFPGDFVPVYQQPPNENKVDLTTTITNLKNKTIAPQNYEHKDSVMLYLLGGPVGWPQAKMQGWTMAMQLMNSMPTYLINQSQWEDGKELAFDKSNGKIKYTEATAWEVMKNNIIKLEATVRKFAAQGKKVYINGHSWGSFVTNFWYSQFGDKSKFEHAITAATRIEWEPQVVKAFSNSADGTKGGHMVFFKPEQDRYLNLPWNDPKNAYYHDASHGQFENDKEKTPNIMRLFQAQLKHSNFINWWKQEGFTNSNKKFTVAHGDFDSQTGLFTNTERDFLKTSNISEIYITTPKRQEIATKARAIEAEIQNMIKQNMPHDQIEAKKDEKYNLLAHVEGSHMLQPLFTHGNPEYLLGSKWDIVK